MDNPSVPIIKSRGYWRVVIRPTVFQQERFTSLAELERAFNDSRVQLRGWDYPHDPSDGVRRAADYIEGSVDWAEHKEVWRLYQSGQFVHLFAMREDWWDDGIPLSGGGHIKPGTHVSLLSTIFSFTEICLFAARLTERLALGPEVVLSYEIFNLADRQLQVFHSDRSPLHSSRRSSSAFKKFERELTLKPEDLVARAPEIAVDQALALFEGFNWEPSRESVVDDQRRFLEKRM
jgi:hypothetical protein